MCIWIDLKGVWCTHCHDCGTTLRNPHTHVMPKFCGKCGHVVDNCMRVEDLAIEDIIPGINDDDDWEDWLDDSWLGVQKARPEPIQDLRAKALDDLPYQWEVISEDSRHKLTCLYVGPQRMAGEFLRRARGIYLAHAKVKPLEMDWAKYYIQPLGTSHVDVDHTRRSN